MLSVGKAFLTIVPDVSRLKQDLARSVDPAVSSSMKRVGQQMQGVGLGMTAGITLPLVALGKQAFDAASALEDVSAAAQVTFGKATPMVQSFADTALESFGITETAALDAATSFAALGKSAGLQGPELAGFSTKMVGLAGDLSSFRGTSVEDALTAIGSGLRGEAEPLRKYGVLLDDATLRAEAMRMGLIKTTDEALTPQQKVLAAQSQILKQTGDAQGDFVRTADSAANSTKVMTGSMQEATASLGEALLPVITSVVNALTPLLNVFTNMPGPVKTVVVVIGLLLAIAGPLIAMIGTVISTLATLGVTFTISLGPILLVVAAIAAVIAVGYLVVRNWDTIKRVALSVWRAITGAVRKAWETIKGAALAVFGWLRKNWPTVLAIITGPIGLAVLFVVRNWQRIKAAAAGVIDWLRGAWRAVADFIKGVWRGIASFVSGMWDGIVDGRAGGDQLFDRRAERAR